MPHIAISMIPGRNHEVKRELALKVQDFICSELKLDKTVASVSIEDIPKEHWGDHMKKFSQETIFTDQS